MKQKIQPLLNKRRSILQVIIVVFMLSFVMQIEAKPLKQFTPPTHISLEMFALRANGSVNDDFDDPHCSLADLPDDTQETRFVYGCTFYDGTYEETSPGQGNGIRKLYPFNNFSIVIGYETHEETGTAPGVQLGYIHNVISQEMAEGSPLASYTAQAIVSRTYAYLQTNSGTIAINNSSSRQVYIPYRYDGLGEGSGNPVKADRRNTVNKAVTLPGPP